MISAMVKEMNAKYFEENKEAIMACQWCSITGFRSCDGKGCGMCAKGTCQLEIKA